MLERLLQLDIEQAIVWQQWDEGQDDFEKSPTSYFVGTAGAAAGFFSVGYVLWALRGGAILTAVASSLPTWRLIDPAAILTAYRASQSRHAGSRRPTAGVAISCDARLGTIGTHGMTGSIEKVSIGFSIDA